MTTDPQTTDLFVPPAAEGLPLAALDSATEGADRLDAAALTPTGRNFLAHALVQLARDGWLRTEASEGFEPTRDREEPTDEPEPAAVPVSAAAPAVWIDGHPQLEAIAATVWERCGRSDGGSLVVDDPRNIAVAALAAVWGVLPTAADRAAEIEALHEQHRASLRRADEINNELMEEVQRYAAGTERPVLWSVYNQMHLRADNAEARAAAMERAMESTAADALKHRGCHRDLMGQCLRAERAEAAIERVQEFAASLDEIGRQLAGPEAVHPVAAHVRHLLDTTAAEAPEPATQQGPPTPDTPRCAHCTHPKGDHSDRKDHTPSRIVPRRPWCHACDATCDYADHAAPAAVQTEEA